MQKLYSQCLETTNIEKAIQVVFSHEGAKTAGKDGISKSSNISQERIVKEVKLRLRRYKPVQSRKVQIPKGNGEYRELTILNLFDRIAQQAVCQIISPILAKECPSTATASEKISEQNKDIYTVELDFKKCFDNIPLDKAIGCLKETILGPLLANCYLTQLDRFMEKSFTLNTVDKQYSRNYKKHEENWIQWNLERGKKIHFLGFKIVKTGRSVWLLVDNFKEYAARLKQFKFNTYAQAVADKLYRRSKHGILKKVGNKYYYGNGRERVYIDV